MSRMSGNINMCLGIIIIGIILDFLLPDIDPFLFRFPINAILIIVIALISIIGYTQYRTSKFVRILQSRSMSIAIMTSFVLMICLIGTIPQDRFMQRVADESYLRDLGLFTVRTSYPFIMLATAMFVSLGLVVVKHIIIWKRRSIILWSGHLGLWLILAAGLWGSPDFREQRATIFEGNKVGMGVGADGLIEPLNLIIQLNSFEVEYNTQGGAKYFASDVEVFDRGGKSLSKSTIEVNKPLRIGSYFIYQTGYEQGSDGDDNDVSILKVVYDPWVWCWYCGIGLLILCALMMIFTPNKLGLKSSKYELG